MCCICALRGAKDPVSLLEFWICIGRRGRKDDAGKFGTGDPGKGRLVLVSAPDLEEVEEVGCSGVDSNEVGGGVWAWVGDGGYGEMFRSLVKVS